VEGHWITVHSDHVGAVFVSGSNINTDLLHKRKGSANCGEHHAADDGHYYRKRLH
jgi:hypothetical protein